MTKLEKVELERGESLIEKVPHVELNIPGTRSSRIFPGTRDGECTLYARLSPETMRVRSVSTGARTEHGTFKRSEFVVGDYWKDDYWGTNIRVDVNCDFSAVYRDSIALIGFINYCTDDYWLATHHYMKIENEGEMVVKWLQMLNETTENHIPTI